MRLCDAPVGLFLFGDTLCLMTEYSSEGCGRHAYIVSSGEMFWGGAKSKEERANLEVVPVTVSPGGLRPQERAMWIPYYNGGIDRREYRCSKCWNGTQNNQDPRCLNCGSEMLRGL